MEKIFKLMIIWTICTYNAESKSLPQRMKRFILQPDTVTKNFLYPSPTKTPNSANTNSHLLIQPVPTASFTFLNNATKCHNKRSADYERVILDDDSLQERYLELIGDIDRNIFARTLEEAETNFKHILATPEKQSKHPHLNKKHKKSDFIDDLNKYESWFKAMLEDMTVRNETLDDVATTPNEQLEDILRDIGITKAELRQILDLKHDIDELKHFRLSKQQRIKRSTIGAVRSEKAYCTERGKPTGTSYLHLCSTCAMTTQFSDNMFPRYTNEITCDQSDCDCMQPTTNLAYGKCQPIVKTVTMLKRSDNGCRWAIKNGVHVIVDEWEMYQQPLHVGCECMVNKLSVLAKLVPKH